MSVLSQAAIVRAGAALNELNEFQRRNITAAWANPGFRNRVTDAIDPKLVNLGLAVVEFYSDIPLAELEAMRAQSDPLVLAVRADLDRAKHEIESLHNHIVLLNAKNNALRASLDATSARAREVDTDFAVMRGTLNTQF